MTQILFKGKPWCTVVLQTLQFVSTSQQICSNPTRYGVFLIVHGLSQPRNFQYQSQQLIMARTMIKGTQKSKFVMRMPVENKPKPLTTATRQFICNHGSFNYTFVSTLCAIIGHFATFEGWALDPSNVECFVGEPRILVLNSSKWCKMISLNNDTTLNAYIPG